MRSSVFAYSFIAGLTLVTISPAPADAMTACQRSYISQYERAPTHKAVATTAGRPLSARRTACGFANGMKSRAAASAKALRNCNIISRAMKAGRCVVLRVK